MLRLTIVGPDSQLGSTLCAACPQGPAGCCVAPPSVDFSDIGRIVARGGRDFLAARIAAKDLIPVEKGLAVRRVKRREAPTEPMERKCVFHGKGGCTIDTSMRPATCNYFLCEDAFTRGATKEATKTARNAHAALRALFERWDETLIARIPLAFPEGPIWDLAFLDWLGEAFQELESASKNELSALTVVDGA